MRELWMLGALGLAAATLAARQGDLDESERRLVEVMALAQRLRRTPDTSLLSATMGRMILVNWVWAQQAFTKQQKARMADGLLRALPDPADWSQVLLNHRDSVMLSLRQPEPPPTLWSLEVHRATPRPRISEYYAFLAQEMPAGHFQAVADALTLIVPDRVFPKSWQGEIAARLHPNDTAAWALLNVADFQQLTQFCVEEPYIENSLRACEVELRGLPKGAPLPPDAYSPGQPLQWGEGFLRSCGPDGDDDGPAGIVQEGPGSYAPGAFDKHLDLLRTDGDLVYPF